VDKLTRFSFLQFIARKFLTSMSHVNFKEVASSSAAYALRDAFDAGVIAKMQAGLEASSPNHILGADSATPLSAGVYDGAGAIDLGLSETDPLDVLARMARLLDAQNVPEDMSSFLKALLSCCLLTLTPVRVQSVMVS
jgi:hypothetical protein